MPTRKSPPVPLLTVDTPTLKRLAEQVAQHVGWQLAELRSTLRQLATVLDNIALQVGALGSQQEIERLRAEKKAEREERLRRGAEYIRRYRASERAKQVPAARARKAGPTAGPVAGQAVGPARPGDPMTQPVLVPRE